MIGISGTLLLPPPSAPSTGAGGGRASSVAAVVPSQPPGADRRDEAPRRDAVPAGRLEPERAEASPRKAGSAARWPERDRPWPSIGRASPTAGDASSALPFLAQQIAQEVLSSGLYWEPWMAGQAAYRRAGGEPPLPPGGPALVRLAV
jgi:hypothetical protein